MKGLIKTGGMTALAISALLAMNCTSEEKSADYIGPSQIEIKDGKMTPEALLAFGRLSDPQLSPDGKHILYGVSYTSIEETLAKVTESGGAVVMDKQPISDTSWWAIFTDPDGNTIGLYEGTTDTSG